ncbi:MAG: hypothetical protein GWN01_01670, partial [Nitrosopumilaceae archaeon]|nr:hypothetical protein [Nitrosopumilaceae archaeon]NIV66663.1 hypothetical protein [Nitrosopumilaceae archaeon]NIX60286.1 hypothetical protein [Nitrosopumilaceae archaeon]
LKLKEDELLKRKKELEGFMPKLIKKKKVKELLSWVAKLVQGGIIHEGKMRSQYVVLLKVADDFSDDKLDYHINNTKKLVTKRYQR